MSGYTLSHRDKWSNPVFRNLLEAGIWSWMCDTAAWKDTRVRFNGQLITLKRGQLAVSERFISEGFGIGRQIVRTFLENLENDRMITRELTQSSTIITICNYAKYQVEETTANPPANPPSNPDLTHSQPTPNPNKNEGNEGNKENITTLQALVQEDITGWLLQQEMIGNKITIDVRMEIERFRSCFTASGGKDKYGKMIENSQWIGKLQSWILNEQKQHKFRGKNEKTGRIDGKLHSGQDRGQAAGASITERTVSAVDAIIAAKTAKHLASQQHPENP